MVSRQSAIQTIQKLTCEHSKDRYRESLKRTNNKRALKSTKRDKKNHTDLGFDSQRAAAISTK